ncbi:alpha/beta hydrolase [Salinispirillum sp. LH 10-3-1]|uniref:Alpha/beta hydrolase n=1 Tax=Salinispirillum sp. LH 10-3-1 TaxID=2952525 RepID=A0AB38YCP9_9GAMM
MATSILAGVITLVLVALLYMAVRYTLWKSKKIKALAAVSEVIQTAVGPIEYRITGSGEAVMLFLPGSPGGYDQFQSSPELEAAPYRVLTVSRPGYLRTPLATGRTPAEQATAYAALLDALGIEKVIVMAASGGGPSGIAFASMYPERTVGLITMAAVSQPRMLDEQAAKSQGAGLLDSDFFNWLALGVLSKKDERLVGMLVKGTDNQASMLQDPVGLQMFRRTVLSTQPPSLRKPGFDNDNEQFSVLNLPAESIQVPTLVVHGTEDVNVPFEFSARLARQIPNAQFAQVDGADHYLRFSHKAKFDELVTTFVTQVLADSASGEHAESPSH